MKKRRYRKHFEELVEDTNNISIDNKITSEEKQQITQYQKKK